MPSDLANGGDEQAVWARVQELFATGRYAVDRLKGQDLPNYPEWSEERHYYLRPAIVGSEGKLFDTSYDGGRCTFHQHDGCALTPAARYKCSYPKSWDGLQAIARAWAPHYARIEALSLA